MKGKPIFDGDILKKPLVYNSVLKKKEKKHKIKSSPSQ